jgi:hypothetical protein
MLIPGFFPNPDKKWFAILIGVFLFILFICLSIAVILMVSRK